MRALQASGCGATPSPSTSATRDAASSVPPSAVVRNRQSASSAVNCFCPHQRGEGISASFGQAVFPDATRRWLHFLLPLRTASVARKQAISLSSVSKPCPTCSKRTQSSVPPELGFLSQSVRAMRSPTRATGRHFCEAFDFGGDWRCRSATEAPSIRT